MRNRFLKILKDQSGASFMFVLGVMLMLMAIGVSTLNVSSASTSKPTNASTTVAASANAGFAIRQKERNQMMLLENSIHKNILYSLQKHPMDDNFLSAQLVKAIYQANDPDSPNYSAGGLGDVALSIDLSDIIAASAWDGGDIEVESTISFPQQAVFISPPVPATPAAEVGSDPIPREPKTAAVNASMTVTVTITANEKTITSRASYRYTNGMLSDDPDGDYMDADPPTPVEMQFAAGGGGKWELTKYEH